MQRPPSFLLTLSRTPGGVDTVRVSVPPWSVRVPGFGLLCVESLRTAPCAPGSPLSWPGARGQLLGHAAQGLVRWKRPRSAPEGGAGRAAGPVSAPSSACGAVVHVLSSILSGVQVSAVDRECGFWRFKAEGSVEVTTLSVVRHEAVGVLRSLACFPFRLITCAESGSRRGAPRCSDHRPLPARRECPGAPHGPSALGSWLC